MFGLASPGGGLGAFILPWHPLVSTPCLFTSPPAVRTNYIAILKSLGRKYFDLVYTIGRALFFSQGYSLQFFSHFCSFLVVWGFWVLDWVFGVGIFSWWGGVWCDSALNKNLETLALFFPSFILDIFFSFLLILIWRFGGWGCGVGVLNWVFGVGLFSW